MFTISKTDTLALPAMKQQKQEYHTFRFNGTLRHEQNLEDFSRGFEEVLAARNYSMLPGASDILSSYYNGSDFVVTIVIGQITSLVYCPSLHWYQTFMKEYGSSISVWHLVAPFPKHVPLDPTLYRTINLRRGY